MALKCLQAEQFNGLNVSKLDNSDSKMQSDIDTDNQSEVDEKKLEISFSNMEEKKLHIDEDGNRPSVLEDEDSYQLPDTQNRELQNSENHELHSTRESDLPSPVQSPGCDARILSSVPVPLHLQLDRHREQLVGEPQLHVQEMSSTVPSPGKKNIFSLLKNNTRIVHSFDPRGSFFWHCSSFIFLFSWFRSKMY